MTATVASAPGKIVLCGEYAVLGGAPAVSMAVDRRARVSVSVFDGDWHRVTAPGFTAVEGRFLADGAAIDWLQGEREYRIVDAVWWTLDGCAVVRPANSHLSIELDTRSFVDVASGQKIGIGSSAALTVALVAALLQSTDVFSQALQAHTVFQNGVGSGVDVATAASSGLVLYRMSDADVSRLRWPSGLAYRVLWTGIAANTQKKLEQLRTSGLGSSGDKLIAASETMAEAWSSAADVLHGYPAYIEALRQFSVDHKLGVFDAGHDRLVAAAAAQGLVYKPCGAGGGDVGILLGSDDGQLDRFIASSAACGCQVVDCLLDADGVVLEER